MSDWENSFAYWIIRHSEQKFNYYAREIIINDSQAAQHLADELLVADSDHQWLFLVETHYYTRLCVAL